MNVYRLIRAYLSGKKPFVVNNGNEIRYVLHRNFEKCQGRFGGWKTKGISWVEYIKKWLLGYKPNKNRNIK